MGHDTPADSEHNDLTDIIGVIKERIGETKDSSRRREDYTRYIIAFLLTAAFFSLPVVLFWMTQNYNQGLLKKSQPNISSQGASSVVEPINPNEILTATFSYASSPLAFMLGYYFNKSKDHE